jgi:NTE family protein
MVMQHAVQYRSMVWERPPRPRTVGYALGGGAARGIAHIGALSVLEEHGIYPDFIAGTSIGAVVGGLYAAGFSPLRMKALLEDLRWRDVAGISLPAINLASLSLSVQGMAGLVGITGLFDLDKLVPWINQRLGTPVRFDQLNIPFAAVATDVVTGEAVVLNEGTVAEAVRASAGVPGIFTPVRRGARLLVDGAVSANLPVAVAREMGADYVIGFDLLPASGAVWYSRDEPKLTEPANLLEILVHTIYAMVRLTQAYGPLPEIVIEPQIGHISFTDLRAGNKLYDLGRAAAEAVAPQILQDLGRTPAPTTPPTVPDGVLLTAPRPPTAPA